MPRIGRYWEGHGGIYAGITATREGDFHLILGEQTKRDMPWQLGSDWAKAYTADGHLDFGLPTRKEAALLYANLQSQFPDLWFWTCEPYPADPECAWVQTFGYGRQADARRFDACRACAVRTECA